MKYKKCPQCDLNWIEENEKLCSACMEKTYIQTKIQHPKPKTSVEFNEDFIVKNELETYRGKHGYRAYTLAGKNIGIIFMTDDKRTPAYEHCEFAFFEKYHSIHGEFHRIISNGQRIKWDYLCRELNKYKQLKIHVD